MDSWKDFSFIITVQSHVAECVRACMCLCFSTHRLQRLEAAVEEEVPDDFAVLEGRDVPYEEIRQNSQRGGEDDPADEQRERDTPATSADGNTKYLFISITHFQSL